MGPGKKGEALVDLGVGCREEGVVKAERERGDAVGRLGGKSSLHATFLSSSLTCSAWGVGWLQVGQAERKGSSGGTWWQQERERGEPRGEGRWHGLGLGWS